MSFGFFFGFFNIYYNLLYFITIFFFLYYITDADVRFSVLASLDESFDQHLGQAENLSSLFVAMNDEIFQIRELAVCTIGRLSSVNPAYAMPSLRKTLIQVFTFHYVVCWLILFLYLG
jgi:phosphatidylinositol kinase/protein kinase (PI-3  family)